VGKDPPGTHCTAGWVGPRAGLDTRLEEKSFRLRWGSNPHCPFIQSVARHYTDWATLAHIQIVYNTFLCWKVHNYMLQSLNTAWAWLWTDLKCVPVLMFTPELAFYNNNWICAIQNHHLADTQSAASLPAAEENYKDISHRYTVELPVTFSFQ
jgi:hypothetical protein